MCLSLRAQRWGELSQTVMCCSACVLWYNSVMLFCAFCFQTITQQLERLINCVIWKRHETTQNLSLIDCFHQVSVYVEMQTNEGISVNMTLWYLGNTIQSPSVMDLWPPTLTALGINNTKWIYCTPRYFYDKHDKQVSVYKFHFAYISPSMQCRCNDKQMWAWLIVNNRRMIDKRKNKRKNYLLLSFAIFTTSLYLCTHVN